MEHEGAPAESFEAVRELCRRRRPRDRRFLDPGYLPWLYEQNPIAQGVHTEVWRDGACLAHVGAVPQYWRNAAGTQGFGLIVNFMTAGDPRGIGNLPYLIAKMREAAFALDAPGAFAVTNAASTPVATRILRGRHLGALPVLLLRPSGDLRGVRSAVLDPGALDAEHLPWLDEVDAHAASGWTQRWTPETLRWRLSWPGQTYAVHETDDLVAISTAHRKFGVRFAVILKLLPRRGYPGPHDAGPLVAAACRLHRARVGVYAGYNALVPMRGLALPRRVLPSPLHLTYLGSEAGAVPPPMAVDTFEFLDFDSF